MPTTRSCSLGDEPGDSVGPEQVLDQHLRELGRAGFDGEVVL
jgi:hypothetical protein